MRWMNVVCLANSRRWVDACRIITTDATESRALGVATAPKLGAPKNPLSPKNLLMTKWTAVSLCEDCNSARTQEAALEFDRFNELAHAALSRAEYPARRERLVETFRSWR